VSRAGASGNLFQPGKKFPTNSGALIPQRDGEIRSKGFPSGPNEL
jgi:hypothetical protein